MKKCGRCGKKKEFAEFNKDKYSKSGYRSQCKLCMTAERKRLAKHYKKWRSTPERLALYAEYRKKRYDKVKMKARNATRKLTKQPCEKCGAKKVEAHHDDYAEPLNVRWLCSCCHNLWHKDHGEAKNP